MAAAALMVAAMASVVCAPASVAAARVAFYLFCLWMVDDGWRLVGLMGWGGVAHIHACLTKPIHPCIPRDNTDNAPEWPPRC